MSYNTPIPKPHLARLRAAYLHQINQGPLPSYTDIRILEKSHHTKNMIHVYRRLNEKTEYFPGLFRRTIYTITLKYEGLVALGVEKPGSGFSGWAMD
jgi:hypothetical protein